MMGSLMLLLALGQFDYHPPLDIAAPTREEIPTTTYQGQSDSERITSDLNASWEAERDLQRLNAPRLVPAKSRYPGDTAWGRWANIQHEQRHPNAGWSLAQPFMDQDTSAVGEDSTQ